MEVQRLEPSRDGMPSPENDGLGLRNAIPSELRRPLETSIDVRVIKLANGAELSGYTLGGKTDGLGVFRIVQQDVAKGPHCEYAGRYGKGTVHGVGSFRFPNGNVFLGQHWNGERRGVGVYEFASGSRYLGEHEGDRRHGYGV